MTKRLLFLALVALFGLFFVGCTSKDVGVTSPAVPGASAGAGVSSSGSYQDMARQDALAAGIDPDLFVRQIDEESGFNPDEMSGAGAVGIAQFMPSTAAGLGFDPHDPAASLYQAAQLMGRYYRKYGSYEMALAAYNAGSGRVAWAVQNCAYWRNCLPSETNRYIDTIMGG